MSVASASGGSPAGWLLFVVFLVGAGIAAYSWWARQRAVSEVRAWALLRGFTYYTSDASVFSRYSVHPFGIGKQRQATSVVTGVIGGVSLALFSYQYTQGSGRDKQTVRHRVAAVHVGVWVLPVRVAEENVVTRAWGSVSGTDLDLESLAFNKAFRVSAQDRPVAVALLHPRAMEYLLAHRHETCTWEMGDLILTDRGEWSTDRLDRAVADLVALAGLTPEHIRRAYGAAADVAGGQA